MSSALAEESSSVALAVGAVAERGRMLPCVIFMFIWSTIIYDPIACWTWNPAGWVSQMGGIDFAGGTPVHIASGSAALAYSLMLGKRRGHGTHELNFRPHNVTQIIIGTVFLWVGWFGFNAGSALSANMRAVMAAVNTNIAASVGGVTWCLLDYRLEKVVSCRVLLRSCRWTCCNHPGIRLRTTLGSCHLWCSSRLLVQLRDQSEVLSWYR